MKKLKRGISLIATIVLLMVYVPYIQVNAAAEFIQYIVSTQRVVFTSRAATSANHDSVPIITPIGYFVDVYKNGTDTTSQGTVFMTDTGRGAAYYRQEDGYGVSIAPDYCSWIDINEIIKQFEQEYSIAKSQEIQNLFTTGNAYIRINALMTIAITTGAGDGKQDRAKVSGWNPGSTDDRIACVQVRVVGKNKRITAANVKSDLALLNSNSSHSAAYSKNSSLKCLEIYPTKWAPGNGPVVGCYANTKSHQIVYSNLEVGGVCDSYYFSDKAAIRNGYYGIAIRIQGYEKPNIKTNVYFKNSSGTRVSTAVEGTTLIPVYEIINDSLTARKVQITCKNNYTNRNDYSGTVTINKGATYTIQGSSFIVQYSSSYPRNETDPISATATAYLEGGSSTLGYERITTDNVYTCSLSLKINKPTATHKISNVISGQVKTTVYSGEPIHVYHEFINQSTFSATFRLFGNRRQSSETVYENFNNTQSSIPSKNLASRTGSVFYPKYSKSSVLTIYSQLYWIYDSSISYTLSTNLTVLPSDVEAVGVTLKDAITGETVNNPYIGQTLYPVYTIKNNTADRVYATVLASRNGISDFYGMSLNTSINANSTSTIQGATFIVDYNYKYLRYTLSVYLNGFVGDTSYETNGTNNTVTKTFQVQQPVTAEFLTPNSDYRPGTEVISTFKLTNTTASPAYNSTGLKAALTVYINGTAIGTPEVQYVFPSKQQTLVWFKWTVPKDATIGSVTLLLNLDVNGNWFKSEFTNDKYYVSYWNISSVVKSNTPDTAFASNVPPWYQYSFNLDKNKSVYTDIILNNASWSYYYESSPNTLQVRTSSVSINKSHLFQIVPANSPSAEYKNGKYYMKSGYGFSLFANSPGMVFFNVMPNDYTLPQRMYVLYPEFMYQAKAGQAASSFLIPPAGQRYGFKKITSWDDKLNKGIYGIFSELEKVNSGFQLPKNALNGERIHYTPIWYPNGEYYLTGYVYDCWTPAGMLSAYYISNPIYINGSMLDDYYIAGT